MRYIKAVSLRSTEGICALSGGVDSSLVACLAQRPCLAIGLAGSHDLARAEHAAGAMDLPCTCIEITPEDVREGLTAVIGVIPEPTPVNTAIAVTQYPITRSARELGHERVLTGQGADESSGGMPGTGPARIPGPSSVVTLPASPARGSATSRLLP